MYLDELGKHPEKFKTLTDEEFNDLFIKFKNGDNEAYDKLFMHNLKLVYYEVNKKFSFIDCDKQDLVQVGNIGLIKSLNSFDISKKIKFVTYAVRCIDNEILQFFRKNKKHINIIDSLDDAVSLDKDGNELKLIDTLIDETNISEDYFKKEKYEEIRKIVNLLPPREQEIIKMRFGFDSYKVHTERQMAEQFNLSQPHISRLIKQSLIQIKSYLELKNQNVNIFPIKSNQPKEIVKNKSNDMKNISITQKNTTKTIYEIYNSYSEEQVDKAISLLSQEHQNLIYLRYGKNLKKPILQEMTNDQIKKFYLEMRPQLKMILSSMESKSKGRKVKNIYELLGDYSKEEVDNVISNLKDEEKQLIKLRYGENLEHPKSSGKLSKEEHYNFYNILLPKIRRKLSESKEKNIKKIKTIYELLGDYSKEEVDNVISNLNDEEKELIKLRYENDLGNPKTNENFKKEHTYKFYQLLIPKIKARLNKIKTNNVKILSESCDNNSFKSKSDVIKIETQNNLNTKVAENNELLKEDFIKILEMIKTPTFNEMISNLGVKEAVIISLRLGYIDNKYFSTESISNFLGINEEEVIEITKNVLLLYKNKFNKFIDEIIEFTGHQKILK